MSCSDPDGHVSPAAAWWRSPTFWLAVVAVIHAASPILVLGVHWWFGIDETVYLSQLNKYVQPGVFSAPRARGATLIAAPVTSYTSSTGAVRLWLAILSGIGLFAGFAPWLRSRRPRLVPVAAALFATPWTVIFYGFTVMPNEWVAYGSIAACGLIITFLIEGRRPALLAAALAVAIVGLFRPSDALYLLAGLTLGGLVITAPWRRRLLCVAGLVTGFIAGILEWVLEAEVRFGGLLHRVRAAQAENGGGWLHFAGAAQVRALAGPVLCRNGCRAHAPVWYQLWWIALIFFVAVGVWRARTRRGPRIEMVATLAGLVIAAQYVFTVTYAAPRFLIPAYALLSVPCASGVVEVVRGVRPRLPRASVAVLLAAALTIHVALQIRVITHALMPSALRTYHSLLADARQLRRVGVSRPCLVVGGARVEQTAYATGCTDTPANISSMRTSAISGTLVVWLYDIRPPAWPGVTWTATTARSPGAGWTTAYLGRATASRCALTASHAQRR